MIDPFANEVQFSASFKTNRVSNHRAACSLRQPGTGNWFVQGERFTLWKDSRRSSLWLYGIRKYPASLGMSFFADALMSKTGSGKQY